MIRLDLSREPRWLDLGHGVRLRVASVAALRDAMSSAATKIDETAAATGRLDEAFEAVGGAGGSTGGDEASEAAGSAGRAAASGRQVGTAITTATEQAVTGWAAVRDEFVRYAEEAVNWGKGLGTALTGAFRSAEDALAGFVAGGKLNFQGLAVSIMADISRIAIRSAILGPSAPPVRRGRRSRWS